MQKPNLEGCKTRYEVERAMEDQGFVTKGKRPLFAVPDYSYDKDAVGFDHVHAAAAEIASESFQVIRDSHGVVWVSRFNYQRKESRSQTDMRLLLWLVTVFTFPLAFTLSRMAALVAP